MVTRFFLKKLCDKIQNTSSSFSLLLDVSYLIFNWRQEWTTLYRYFSVYHTSSLSWADKFWNIGEFGSLRVAFQDWFRERAPLNTTGAGK